MCWIEVRTSRLGSRITPAQGFAEENGVNLHAAVVDDNAQGSRGVRATATRIDLQN